MQSSSSLAAFSFLSQSRAANIAFWLLSLYILILPIGHVTALRSLVFFSLVALTLWHCWYHRKKPIFPLVGPWLAYAAIALASLTYALDPAYSLSEIKVEIFYSIAIMVIAATWIASPHSLRKLVWIIVTGNTLLVSLILFVSAAHINSFHGGQDLTLLSSIWVGGGGKYGTHLIISLPFVVACAFSVTRWKRIALLVLVAGNLACLYATGNRAGFLALFVEIAAAGLILLPHFKLPLRAKHALLVALCAVGAVTTLLGWEMVSHRADLEMMSHRADSAENIVAVLHKDARWAGWSATINYAIKSPFHGAGFGLNAFKMKNPDYASRFHDPGLWHGHNLFANAIWQMGIPGAIALAVLLIAVLWKIWRLLLRIPPDQGPMRLFALAGIAMTLGLIAKNQTDQFLYRDIAWMFWLIVGGLLSSLASSSNCTTTTGHASQTA
jgi:O-antigen ligase